MTKTEFDVVIVGAGPIGITSALLLARRGYRVGLFERHHAPYPLPRAVAMSHDSLRVFQSAGQFEAIQPALEMDYGESAVEFMGEGGDVLIRSSFVGPSESGYPHMSGFNQPDAEAILDAAAQADPLVTVRRGWSISALDQDADTVRATFVATGGNGDPAAEGATDTVSARFVIGSDGANSSVRGLIGAEMHDMGFAADWLVVDIVSKIERTWLMWLGQKMYGRPTTYAPAGPGRRRFEFMLLPEEDRAQFASPAAVWRLLADVDVNPDNAELVRGVVYTFRGRWAENWRNGRVLLAGDAAHQMPPLMAQGFNSGMRDAVALAWRLDLLLSDRAPLDLLDSYTSERLPHVRQIVEQSVGIGNLICILDVEAQRARDAYLRETRGDPSAPTPSPPPWRLGEGVVLPGDDNAGFLGLQAQVAIDGRKGLLDDVIGPGHFVMVSGAGDPGAALSDEARAIWQTLGGVSLHIAQNAPVQDVDGAYGEWLARLGAAVVIIRPDYYVYGSAATLDAADALVRCLGRQIGLKATAPGRDAGAKIEA